MTSVIHAGVGKRRYGLRQKLRHRLAGAAIMIGVSALLLATTDMTTDDLPTWAAVMLLFGFALEGVYRLYNFVIIHPEHIDVSRVFWGNKARKRTRHRIRYEDVLAVVVEGERLTIGFRLNRKLLKIVGITEWRVDVELPTKDDAEEIRLAIELGRARATDPHSHLTPVF